MMKKIIFILYCSTLVLFTANAEDIKNKLNELIDNKKYDFE